MSRVFCCAASNNSALFSFVEENDDETAATLRAELKGLPLSTLHKQSLEAGADAQAAEQALDAADPKAELINLILSAKPWDASNQQTQALRQELQGLGLAGLRRRATADGLDPAHVDRALDASDPKVALSELVVAAALASAATPSDEEIDVHLRALFERVDANHSGHVDRDGVQHAAV